MFEYYKIYRRTKHLLQLSCPPRQCIAELEVYIREHPGLKPHKKAKMEVLTAIAQSELDSAKALEKREAYKRLGEMRVPLYLPGDESLNARINLARYRYYHCAPDERAQANDELIRLFYSERREMRDFLRKRYKVHYDYAYGVNCQYAGYSGDAREKYESVLRNAPGLEALCRSAAQRLRELDQTDGEEQRFVDDK